MAAVVSEQDRKSAPKRYAALDMARGVAIIGVVLFHFIWDLRYLEFISINMRETPALVAFQAVLQASFLMLAGASLVLAHGDKVRWGAFWRRVGILALAALLVSVGTFILLPAAFVYFGILQALALFSVLALPFLWLPVWLTLSAATVVIVLPAYAQSDIFFETWLSWIGFWPVAPVSLDLVPVFPCFGWVLIGIAVMKLVLLTGAATWLSSFAPNDLVSRAFIWAGRRSLWIYLLHQLVLLAVLYPLAMWLQPGEPSREVAFMGACMSSCTDLGREEKSCSSYCQCSLEFVAGDDLWDIVNAPQSTPEQVEAAGRISRLCAAMTE